MVMTGVLQHNEPTDEPQLSLDSIWSEVGDSIQQFVRRRIRDSHQADDVIADVMFRIHQHVHSIDDRERSTAWVFRITRNAITDHYRRNGRRRETPIPEPEPIAEHPADAWLGDPNDAIAEVAPCVRPLVAALPADYRRALELTDLDGHSQVEAAHMEGISVSGMKSRVQRGRRHFTALVQQCCDITTDRRGDIIGVRHHTDGDGCPGQR
jgi:RNA polymerase sigma-70 factor (ECF subfamily)